MLDDGLWRRRLLIGATALTVALAPMYIVYNVTRPLIGTNSILTNSRTHTLFLPRPQLEQPNREVLATLRELDVS